MYESHPSFTPPLSSANLWRYLNFPKFVSVLEESALFFTRSDKLGDPFEGSFSRLNETLIPQYLKSNIPDDLISDDLLEFMLASQRQFHKKNRRFTLVNCWHENQIESQAMWRLYSEEQDGIAIKTTFERLRDSFTCTEPVHIGRVNYVDYETHTTDEENLLSAYLDKRKSFEHEREVRAIVMKLPPRKDLITESGKTIEGASLDYETDICDVGINFDVDIDVLIQEVLVDARAEDWFLELVRAVARKYSLNAPVNRSDLAREPFWFDT